MDTNQFIHSFLKDLHPTFAALAASKGGALEHPGGHDSTSHEAERPSRADGTASSDAVARHTAMTIHTMLGELPPLPIRPVQSGQQEGEGEGETHRMGGVIEGQAEKDIDWLTFGNLFYGGLVEQNPLAEEEEEVSGERAGMTIFITLGKILSRYAKTMVTANHLALSTFLSIVVMSIVASICVGKVKPLLTAIITIITGVSTLAGTTVAFGMMVPAEKRLTPVDTRGFMEPNLSSTYIVTLLTATLLVVMPTVLQIETSWRVGVNMYDLSNNNAIRAGLITTSAVMLAFTIGFGVDQLLEIMLNVNCTIRTLVYWCIVTTIIVLVCTFAIALKRTFGENPSIRATRTYFFYLPTSGITVSASLMIPL